MTCVPAPACREALDEATRRWPARNRASDGICGDARHQARRSDHNTGDAFDLTHSPEHGVDCNVLAEIVKSDPRVSYVIWNRRIYNPAISHEWRKYRGPNPHAKHMHVSIKTSARNDLRPWFLGAGEDKFMAALSDKEQIELRDSVKSLAETVKGLVADVKSIKKELGDDQHPGSVSHRTGKILDEVKKK